MKNIYKLLGIAALALLFAFVSCSNPASSGGSNDPKPPEAPRYLVGATDVNGSPQVLNLNISGSSKSAGRAVTLSGGQYELEFWGVIVSSGSLSVSGSTYTFTPTSGSPFTLNTATNKFSGTITLTNAAKADLTTLAGSGALIDKFATLTLTDILEAATSADTEWNGTWRQAKNNGNLTSSDYGPKRLVLNGNTYQITNNGSVTESGTFIHFTRDITVNDYASVFVFLRNGLTPKTAHYEYEGEYVGTGPFWLEFTTSWADSMDLARMENGADKEYPFWVKQ
jgi:hypothetical protein